MNISKKIILFGMCILLILLVGCNDYSIPLEAKTNSECILGCKEIMRKRHCQSLVPSYRQIIVNGVLQDNITGCECILMDCIKFVEGE